MRLLTRSDFDGLGCAALLKEKGLTVIKAFGIGENFQFQKLQAYVNKLDFFLFDTKGAQRGGNGVVFDWSVLSGYNIAIPFWLSGGIGPENLFAVLEFHHPQFYGVDLNSRFEIIAALKNVPILADAFALLKA